MINIYLAHLNDDKHLSSTPISLYMPKILYVGQSFRSIEALKIEFRALIYCLYIYILSLVLQHLVHCIYTGTFNCNLTISIKMVNYLRESQVDFRFRKNCKIAPKNHILIKIPYFNN